MWTPRLPPCGELALQALIARHNAHASVPVPIHRIAELEGWEIEYRNDLGVIHGISGIQGDAKLMWINARLSAAEQRAVIGHELGHWLNGDRDIIRTCRWSSFTYYWNRKLERQATIAAARLLIPYWAVTEYRTIEAVASACAVPAWLVDIVFGGGHIDRAKP